eukprot:TRINITY_DN4330_c0_g1_i1.p1 TRINITY_DN4330_c0_g1~~TRINITY_DN4330_c0_g1_i1.p1  ORF type:complete len:529 (-),score=135.25 TRINITY_DN4330_c0_g1_i1:644-2230(-)
MSSSVDPEAPTQVLSQGFVDPNAATQVPEGFVDPEAPTQPILRGKSRSRSRSASSDRSRSRSRSKSGSRSRSRSKSGSRSRSRSKSISRSRSRSNSGSRSRSRSKSGSRSRSRSKYRSRSRSRSKFGSRSRSRSRSNDSRSRSRSKSRSRSHSRGKSGSRSRSVSRSRSRSVSRSRSRSRSVSRSKSRSKSRSVSPPVSRKRSRSPSPSKEEAPKKVEEGAPSSSAKANDSDSSSDEGITASKTDDYERSGVSDFDTMLERKRAEKRGKRRKKDIDLINDNDDAIARLIADMRMAARDDRDLNNQRAPATKKTAMLPLVMTQLNKADLQMAFIEANVLSVLTDWLAPMPDKSLPSLKIRQSILKLLYGVHIEDQSRLKESGIGKAVMYLYKHPKEIRENKELAGRIISNWARPIFNLSTDHRVVSKEERMARDAEEGARRKVVVQEQQEQEGLRPGDEGWCYRARVPATTSSNYINRPEWQSNVDISGGTRKQSSRLDKHMRAVQERKRKSKQKRAVEISIEGRKMGL